MISTILGTKREMSSRFTQAGQQIPVTFIAADSNVVVGISQDKVILGYGQKKKAKKTENAYLKAVGFAPRFIKEIKLKTPKDQTLQDPTLQTPTPQDTTPQINVGDKITVSIFAPGDEIKVTGVTKGRGFAGVVKRWGFAGGPKTHGQSDRHRAPGSIGAGTTPGRVFKGKKMAGHMGAQQLTIRGLEVIEVDTAKNLLVVKGSVPGTQNGLLIIEKTGKVKGYTPPPPPKEKAAEGEPRQEGREQEEEKEETKEPKESESVEKKEEK